MHGLSALALGLRGSSASEVYAPDLVRNPLLAGVQIRLRLTEQLARGPLGALASGGSPGRIWSLGPESCEVESPAALRQDFAEFPEILRLAIRVTDERNVSHTAVDLMSSDGDCVPEVLLSSSFKEASQFLMGWCDRIRPLGLPQER